MIALTLLTAFLGNAPIVSLADTSVLVSVPVNGGALGGTLETPAGPGPWPVVVLIAGSGPTDRDGNSPLLRGKNNSLKYLADALVGRGIATLRYDKRGVGISAKLLKLEADLRFDDMVADADAWIHWLRADHRFTTITVAGHSEGSLVGMLAAADAGADGYVSIAGAGRPAAVILREQEARALPPGLLIQADTFFARLTRGEQVDSVPPKLWLLFRRTIQPYLISWFRHDPAKEIAALHVPVLIAQGTSDVQVDTLDARLLSAGKPDAQLLMIPGMNHVLKMVGSDTTLQMDSYGDPALPVAPALVDGIAALVGRTHLAPSR